MWYKIKRIIGHLNDKRVLRQKGLDSRRISVAITTHNRSQYVNKAIRTIYRDPRIREIVISDDHSDSDDYKQLCSMLNQYTSKVKIYRNKRNYGAFKNKYLALSKCTSEWAVLLDSDNVLPRLYIDKLYTISTWDPDFIYCPDFAKPNFNFSLFSGLILDKCSVAEFLTKTELQTAVRTLLNTGNYFVPVANYTRLVEPFKNLSVYAADVITMVYIWMQNGKKIQVLDGLEYKHTVHPESHFLRNNRDSKLIVQFLSKGFIDGKGLEVLDQMPLQKYGNATS